MKKIMTIILSAILVVGATLALTACDCSGKKKVKVYDTIELTAESYAFAVQQGNETILEAANELLGEIKQNGTLNNIINAFFDGTATFTYENPAAPASFDDTYLVVATNAYFPPFEYFAGNKFTGVDMQIAKLLAEKLGRTLFISDMEFDSIIPSVQNGQADIGMAGMTVTDERLEQVDFTDEYYESAQVITVLEGDETFKNCTTAAQVEAILNAKDKSYNVGTQKGTTGYMYTHGDVDFGYDGFPVTAKEYTTGALAMLDLQNGRVNAVILDKQPSIMIAKSLNG